jgi:hypothetical protein
MNGTQPGSISQSFATTAGTDYSLPFAYANNFNAGSPVATAEVKVTGTITLLDQTVSHSGSTASNMNYALFSGTFVADSPTSTLQFTALNSGPWGIALDAVSVTPEPASLVLFGLGAIGLLLATRRRRKR